MQSQLCVYAYLRVRPAGRWLRHAGAWATLLLLLAGGAAFGGTNQATGDIGGVSTQLLDSNVLVLNSAGNSLALAKRAYLQDGTRVPNASSLPRGSVVVFLVYISNNSTIQVNDISLEDALDPAFVYQTNSIRVDNTLTNCAGALCTPAEEDNLFGTVQLAAPLTDLVDGDVASYSAGTLTIDVGDANVGNLRLDIAAQRVWIMSFTAVVP